jgi:hypothetical protein
VWEADLGDDGDVEGVVELAVAAAREAVGDAPARGHFDGGGAIPATMDGCEAELTACSSSIFVTIASLRYASSTSTPGTNKWRDTARNAASTALDLITPADSSASTS